MKVQQLVYCSVVSLALILSGLYATPPGFDTSVAAASESSATAIMSNLVSNDASAVSVTGPGLQMDWSTFLGGNANSHAVAVDSEGNTYITGYSDSRWGNPVNEFGSGQDAFLAKVGTDGSLDWNTFLGGDGADSGWGVALGPSGKVYVSGSTDSGWGDPVRPHTDDNDGFVACFHYDDGEMLWNTFLGTNGYDSGNGIAVDNNEYIYVTGSSEFTWDDPLQVAGSGNTFVTRLDSSGNIDWISFLGGSGHFLTLDSNWNLVVTGSDENTWGQPVNGYNGNGNSDAWVAQFTSDGALNWNTFLGGSGNDHGLYLDTDSSNNIFLSGRSDAAWGEPVNGYTSGEDAFAAELGSDGNLLWSTFLGGDGDDIGQGIAVDSSGYALVSGYSQAAWGFPQYADCVQQQGIAAGGNQQSAYGGEEDGFAALLNNNGELESLVFLGGAGDDYAVGAVLDAEENFYVAGYSDEGWGNPVQECAGQDSFVAKLEINENENRWSTMVGGDGIYCRSVWGTSATDVFIVGYTGAIEHYDGSAWSTMDSGTDESLFAVWGSSGSDIFAAGYDGTILHYDGSAWDTMDSGTDEWLYDVWGSSGGDVFIAGGHGTILHYDGSNWDEMDSGTGEPLFGIWGSSVNDVFATGANGTILHYKGSAWSSMNVDTSAVLTCIWGSSSTDIFAAGHGIILHYDGSAWSEIFNDTDKCFDGVWGSSENDVFIIGSGTILHYDGSTWSEIYSDTGKSFSGVWGSSGSDVFIVSGNGEILHYDGSTWSHMNGKIEMYEAVWGSSGSDVFAVGSTISHYNGSAWSEMDSGVELGGDFILYCIWGSSGNDVFTGGVTDSPLHYDGNAWGPVSGYDECMYSVWGSSGSDVFAAGDHGNIFHYDGSHWDAMESGTNQSIHAIWGNSGNDVFAVGGHGTILHYDGSDWNEMDSGTDTQLDCIWGSSGSNVFAAGNYGTILHYDGSNWNEMDSGTDQGLNGIWVSSGSDAFAVGNNGTILHYDGSNWYPMDSGTDEFLFSVWGSSGIDVFAVGERVILHYGEDVINHSPAGISLSNTSISENQASNTLVGTFSTTDPDEGDSFSYSLVSGTGDTDNASFNISGDSLRTSAVFDCETQNSYSIRVRSTDNGGLWCEKQFTIIITEETNLDISVMLQGGSRPESGWEVPVTVELFTPGSDVLTATPLYHFELTTAKDGDNAIASAEGIESGTYDITIVSPHCLTSVKRAVAIPAPSASVDMGTLMEGNANNDNKINISDFGILASTYGKQQSEEDFDEQADFDRNGKINIADFGLLSASYGKSSPVEVE
ncbi:MAG: SBBP repeat-containing protein [Dehalococcoidales bacterium]|nr:SBBP repeat-containing protein [Dehalococcoidales bacterium]